MKPIKAVIVSNIPTPYRDVVYESLSNEKDIDLRLIYCAYTENNRGWKTRDNRGYEYEVLKSQTFQFLNRNIYFNLNIYNRLRDLSPDVVVTNSISVPMLIAFLWAKFNGRPHIAFTDGIPRLEKRLPYVNQILKKAVFKVSAACLGASEQTLQYFHSIGIKTEAIFKSCLCTDNTVFGIEKAESHNLRKYDLMFCGQFIDRKCTDFFANVVSELAYQKDDLSVLIVGSGPNEKSFENQLNGADVKLNFLGFVEYEDLPELYSSSKVFLMPTLEDCWGVVLNEAMASGQIVITSPESGAAGELVVDGITGFVIERDVDEWVSQLLDLFDDQDLFRFLKTNASLHVSKYNKNSAASGILDAIKFSVEQE